MYTDLCIKMYRTKNSQTEYEGRYQKFIKSSLSILNSHLGDYSENPYLSRQPKQKNLEYTLSK